MPAGERDPNTDARLAAIVDSSFDAIISKDLNSVIQTWNRGAERLFGYTEAEAVGKSVTMLIPTELLSEETDIISRIRRGERVESYETIRRRKDGSLVEVSLTVSPILAAGGQIVGASKIARDISSAKENERRISLLLREVNHRVKNQFSVILSMIREAAKRTRRPQEFEQEVRDRIMALSRSQDLLVSHEWAGAGLLELIEEHLRPFGHNEQVRLSGPMIMLQPSAVQYLGMAFHELATNACKYGGLSDDAGSVDISWSIDDGEREPTFRLVWRETSATIRATGGDEHRGFGSVVLERVAPQALSGVGSLVRADGSLIWTITAPMSATRIASGLQPIQHGDPLADGRG
jgi:PAS domain S-box-containing protein